MAAFSMDMMIFIKGEDIVQDYLSLEELHALVESLDSKALIQIFLIDTVIFGQT